MEIGCGWGGFAEHVVKSRGSKVSGLTISHEQFNFAKKRIFEASLNEEVEIVFCDYRDDVDLIQEYIFPGGMLPSPQVFVQQAVSADLMVIEHRAFG